MREAAIIRMQELRGIMATIDARVMEDGVFGIDARRDGLSTCFRMAIAYRLRQEGYSFQDIAGAFGQHHSTMIYAVKRMDYVLSSTYHADDWIRELWGEFVDAIGGSGEPLSGEVDRKTVSDAIQQVYECGYISQRGLNMLRTTLGL